MMWSNQKNISLKQKNSLECANETFVPILLLFYSKRFLRCSASIFVNIIHIDSIYSIWYILVKNFVSFFYFDKIKLNNVNFITFFRVKFKFVIEIDERYWVVITNIISGEKFNIASNLEGEWDTLERNEEKIANEVCLASFDIETLNQILKWNKFWNWHCTLQYCTVFNHLNLCMRNCTANAPNKRYVIFKFNRYCSFHRSKWTNLSIQSSF